MRRTTQRLPLLPVDGMTPVLLVLPSELVAGDPDGLPVPDEFDVEEGAEVVPFAPVLPEVVPPMPPELPPDVPDAAAPPPAPPPPPPPPCANANPESATSAAASTAVFFMCISNLHACRLQEKNGM